MPIDQRVRLLWQKFMQLFQNLNLFPSVPSTTNQYELRNQKISTRLFIISLIITLTIILLYTSLIHITKTVNVKTPTLTQYSQLYSTYSQTLTCACTKISINYDKLLHIQYSLHQICTSIFVNENWISYLATSHENYYVSIDDFRWSGTHIFQALSIFCKLINETISDNLIRFYSNQYVSSTVTSSELFQSQVQSLLFQFISSTTDVFFSAFNMIRSTTQSNALLSALMSNYRLGIPDGSADVFVYPNVYFGCDCASSATCSYQSRIYNYSNFMVLFLVPGSYMGCYVIEALLQSTLQCFYNQTCINHLQSYLLSSSPMNVTALDSSLSSQYLENSTIQDLLNQLMVEKWNSSYMYDSYYSECQPIQCTYTYETTNDVIYIVSTLIGLVGGLITVLKLVIPRLVLFFVRYILKRRQVVPETSTLETST